MIKIYSTFSEDITYKNNNLVKKSLRGPAFYIKNVLEKNNIDYKLFKGQNYQVKIKILDNDEIGEIVSKNIPQQKIQDLDKGDNILISTIADEWLLSNDIPKSTKIFLDAQGYLRIFSKNDDFYKQNFWNNIYCLKGTEDEINNLPENIIEQQKQKLLIISKNKDGCSVFHQSKQYDFSIKPVKVEDTIGAGDTFLTNFFIKYLETTNIKKSTKFAITETSKFLSAKEA
ncbi:hypothetical protein HON36_01680 [Candidatus Parcubacteria bacterium]|jgi:hypothetical protein|nr:hypothetical protein [Candidatus Parcubacteria bacterium]MBT7228742.1 hypothetical protein [Candidatus Parcubacteria bacterium]